MPPKLKTSFRSIVDDLRVSPDSPVERSLTQEKIECSPPTNAQTSEEKTDEKTDETKISADEGAATTTTTTTTTARAPSPMLPLPALESDLLSDVAENVEVVQPAATPQDVKEPLPQKTDEKIAMPADKRALEIAQLKTKSVVSAMKGSEALGKRLQELRECVGGGKWRLEPLPPIAVVEETVPALRAAGSARDDLIIEVIDVAFDIHEQLMDKISKLTSVNSSLTSKLEVAKATFAKQLTQRLELVEGAKRNELREKEMEALLNAVSSTSRAIQLELQRCNSNLSKEVKKLSSICESKDAQWANAAEKAEQQTKDTAEAIKLLKEKQQFTEKELQKANTRCASLQMSVRDSTKENTKLADENTTFQSQLKILEWQLEESRTQLAAATTKEKAQPKPLQQPLLADLARENSLKRSSVGVAVSADNATPTKARTLADMSKITGVSVRLLKKANPTLALLDDNAKLPVGTQIVVPHPEEDLLLSSPLQPPPTAALPISNTVKDKKISELEEEIATLLKEKATRQSEISSLKKEIGELHSQLKENHATINNLTHQLVKKEDEEKKRMKKRSPTPTPEELEQALLSQRQEFEQQLVKMRSEMKIVQDDNDRMTALKRQDDEEIVKLRKELEHTQHQLQARTPTAAHVRKRASPPPQHAVELQASSSGVIPPTPTRARTLADFARIAGVTVEEIKKANPALASLSDDAKLPSGTQIAIPESLLQKSPLTTPQQQLRVPLPSFYTQLSPTATVHFREDDLQNQIRVLTEENESLKQQLVVRADSFSSAASNSSKKKEKMAPPPLEPTVQRSVATVARIARVSVAELKEANPALAMLSEDDLLPVGTQFIAPIAPVVKPIPTTKQTPLSEDKGHQHGESLLSFEDSCATIEKLQKIVGDVRQEKKRLEEEAEQLKKKVAELKSENAEMSLEHQREIRQVVGEMMKLKSELASCRRPSSSRTEAYAESAVQTPEQFLLAISEPSVDVAAALEQELAQAKERTAVEETLKEDVARLNREVTEATAALENERKAHKETIAGYERQLEEMRMARGPTVLPAAAAAANNTGLVEVRATTKVRTLAAIAVAHSVAISDVRKVNNCISDVETGALLPVGLKLVLPEQPTSFSTAMSGDLMRSMSDGDGGIGGPVRTPQLELTGEVTLQSYALSHGVSLRAICRANPELNSLYGVTGHIPEGVTIDLPSKNSSFARSPQRSPAAPGAKESPVAVHEGNLPQVEGKVEHHESAATPTAAMVSPAPVRPPLPEPVPSKVMISPNILAASSPHYQQYQPYSVGPVDIPDMPLFAPPSAGMFMSPPPTAPQLSTLPVAPYSNYYDPLPRPAYQPPQQKLSPWQENEFLATRVNHLEFDVKQLEQQLSRARTRIGYDFQHTLEGHQMPAVESSYYHSQQRQRSQQPRTVDDLLREKAKRERSQSSRGSSQPQQQQQQLTIGDPRIEKQLWI